MTNKILKRHGCFASNVLTQLSTDGTGYFDEYIEHEEDLCFGNEVEVR